MCETLVGVHCTSSWKESARIFSTRKTKSREHENLVIEGEDGVSGTSKPKDSSSEEAGFKRSSNMEQEESMVAEGRAEISVRI